MDKKLFFYISYSFLLIILFLSPSRLYNFSLINFQYNNTYIVDSFFNVLDLFSLFLFVIFIFYSKLFIKSIFIFRFSLIVLFLFLFTLISAGFRIQFDFNFEHLVNSLNKFLRFYILFLPFYSFFSHDYFLKRFNAIIILSLIILIIISPLSLEYYEVYGILFSRAGTLGLPPNYLAFISVNLFIYSIFFFKKPFIRFPITLVSISGLLLSASRRGILFAFLFFIFFVLIDIIRLFLNNKKFSSLPKFISSFLFLFLFLFLIFLTPIGSFLLENFEGEIFFRRFIRFIYDFSSFFVDDQRLNDIKIAIDFTVSNPLGFGGSDGYFNGLYFSTGHIHNLFAQIFVIYGVFPSIIISLFLLFTLFKSLSKFIQLAITKNSQINNFVLVFFYINSIAFDMFDYSWGSVKQFYIFVLLFSSAFAFISSKKYISSYHSLLKYNS